MVFSEGHVCTETDVSRFRGNVPPPVTYQIFISQEFGVHFRAPSNPALLPEGLDNSVYPLDLRAHVLNTVTKYVLKNKRKKVCFFKDNFEGTEPNAEFFLFRYEIRLCGCCPSFQGGFGTMLIFLCLLFRFPVRLWRSGKQTKHVVPHRAVPKGSCDCCSGSRLQA